MLSFSRADLLIGLVILAVLLPLIWWRKHSLAYLLAFSLFWFYGLFVVSEIIFPLTPDTGLPHFNLIPLNLGCSLHEPLCLRNFIANILITMPFGFGINFLVSLKPKSYFWLASAVGLGLELSQLAASLAFQSSFHVADINDSILNAIGVLLGYAVFRILGWLYRSLTDVTRSKPGQP
ncbi:MAG TPA: VanZ family protein [Longilinea sp.]|nr:VanZ family protein [Longilinea sp.]